MCVCCWTSGGEAEAGGRTARFNRDGRCAAVGYRARGRLGGQAVCGCMPVENGLLLSTSGFAADEVPGLHCLSLHPVCLSICLYMYLCVLLCMYKYVCVCVGICACQTYGLWLNSWLKLR